MGWLDLLNVGLNVAQVAQMNTVNQQLGSMQDQAALNALQIKILQEIRNIIHDIHRKAKKLEGIQSDYPLQVFTIANVLGNKFEYYGITVDILPDYTDKDRYQDTMEMLEDIIASTQKQLNQESLQLSQACVDAVEKKGLIEEAIRILETKAKFDETNVEWDRLQKIKGNYSMMGVGMLIGAILFFLFSCILYSVLLNSDLSLLSCLPVPIALAGIGAGIYFFTKTPVGHKELKEHRNALKSELPTPQAWQEMQNTIGNLNYEQLLQKRNSYNEIINRVFNVEIDPGLAKLLLDS